MWSDTFYITAFELAREGHSNSTIADSLGVSHVTFSNWLEKMPALVHAVERGRAGSQGNADAGFKEFFYEQLPSELRPLWEQIQGFAKNGKEDEIGGLLSLKSKEIRQRILLHSLVCTQFNVNRALRLASVPMRTYRDWIAKDADFRERMDELEQHLKFFYQNAFNELVAAGNPMAIVHAAKTKLRDWGYGDALKVEHSGETSQPDDLFDLKDVLPHMSTECKAEFALALEKYCEERLAIEVQAKPTR